MKKTTTTTTPNMAKEQRKELRNIKSEITKITKLADDLDRKTDREISVLRRQTYRQQVGLTKIINALGKRRNILAGRLS